MNHLIRFVIIAGAALLSFVPMGWMAIFTLGTLGAVMGKHKGGWILLLATLACLLGYCSAVSFCVRACKHHSLKALRSPWLIIGLVLGVAGLVGLVGGISDETIAGVFSREEGTALRSFLFFISPCVIFMLAGMLCAALPDEPKTTEIAPAECSSEPNAALPPR